MRIPGDMLVLFADAAFPVDHKQHDVAAFNRTHRTQHRVFFNVFIDLAALADTRRIDNNILLAVMFKRSIDRITGRALNIRNNNAFFF